MSTNMSSAKRSDNVALASKQPRLKSDSERMELFKKNPRNSVLTQKEMYEIINQLWYNIPKAYVKGLIHSMSN